MPYVVEGETLLLIRIPTWSYRRKRLYIALVRRRPRRRPAVYPDT